MIQKHYMDIDGIRECQCELMNGKCSVEYYRLTICSRRI